MRGESIKLGKDRGRKGRKPRKRLKGERCKAREGWRGERKIDRERIEGGEV